MPLNLDYFYGSEAEQYSFYRIPKALFTDAHYKAVTVEAKVLYGLLLDRMGLSMRNGWLDSARRVYIYCATPEELVCQQETLDEILAVLALCTEKQRERFLLYALYDFSYEEIAKRDGCTKTAVYGSIEGVRKKFFKIFR